MNAVTFPTQTGRLIRMLATDRDGEALAAVRALNRTLTGAGLSFHDLADRVEMPVSTPAIPSSRRATTWQGLSRWEQVHLLRTLAASDSLSPWEIEFARSVADRIDRFGPRLSAKQAAIVERIVEKGRAA